MIREIKFRGVTPTKRWITGSLIYHGEQPQIEFVTRRHPTDNRVLDTDWAYVDPETVGQFVGLHDDNDSEIYEGDIIHIKCGTVDKNFGIVKWNTNGYFFIDDTFRNKEKDANPIGDFFETLRMSRNDIEITVIGNIHDNPEFLKMMSNETN